MLDMRPSLCLTLCIVGIPFAVRGAANADPGMLDIAPLERTIKKIELACPRVVDRPMLIRVQRTNQATATVRVGDGEQTVKQEDKDEFVFVDRVVELDDKQVKGEFAIVQANRSRDGKPSDPNFAGARLDYRFTFADSNASISTQDGRQIDQDELAELTQMVPGYSLALDLPEAPQIDQVVTADLFPLWRIAIGSAGVMACPEVELKLIAFSPKPGIATLNGPATVEEQLPTATAKYEFDVTLEIDVNEHRLLRAKFFGKSEVDGKQFSGVGSHRLEIVTQVGAPATAALAKTPTYRNTFRPMDSVGVSFELASHWITSPGENGTMAYVRGLDPREEQSTIQVRRIAQVVGAKDEKAFFSGVESTFPKQSMEVVSTTAVSLAGMKGKSYELKQGTSRVSFAALIGKEAIYTLRFECQEGRYTEIRKEYESARASLKMLAK